MAFNLLCDPFVPARMRSGARKWLTFAQLAIGPDQAEDSAVEFDWPRPDLNIASFELCIGVISLAFDIRDEDDWRELWRDPPSPDALTEKLAPLTHAFCLDGDGPRFMQDYEALKGEEIPIERLLIDTPGANGQKKNADLLTHRGRYDSLGRPAAAMALYALQTYAPTGGQGIRTSLRGGGPLTALVVPTSGANGTQVSLWHKVIANVGDRERLNPRDLPKVVPWLAPTVVSNTPNRRELHQSDADAHPLQVFFGMPRRIRLTFSDKIGVCPMTGTQGPLVTGFVQLPGGVNYGLWRHPLTPYRRQTEAGEPYSFKPKSGRFGYRDWVAVTVGDSGGVLADPPINVVRARTRRARIIRSEQAVDPRIRVGGWAVKNMEAIAYLFAEQPLHLAGTLAQQEGLDDIARTMAGASDAAANFLCMALKQARGGGKVPTDHARAVFFEQTEDQFHDLLNAVLQEMPEDGRLSDPLQPGTQWVRIVGRAALEVFDRLAPVPLDNLEAARNVVQAHGRLSASLRGHTARGRALFMRLGLPVPAKRSIRTNSKEITR